MLHYTPKNETKFAEVYESEDPYYFTKLKTLSKYFATS